MGRVATPTRLAHWPRSYHNRGTVMEQLIRIGFKREPWNKGKLVGQKAPLRLKEMWAIRIRLQLGNRARESALFNLAVDSKLRSCDLVRLASGAGRYARGSASRPGRS